MRTHVQKLSACVDRLRERNLNIDEIQVVSKALATLPEKFRVVRSVWSGVPVNERTMDTLLQQLLSEENVMESYSKQGTSNDGAFFVGNRGGFGRESSFSNFSSIEEGKWSVSGSKQPFPLSDILYLMFSSPYDRDW